MSPVTAALCASDPLPPKWPSSMYFLSVVPGAAAGGHRDRNEDAGHDRTDQHSAEGLDPRARTHQRVHPEGERDRHQHRQQRGDHHLLDRGLGEHVHRPRVVRLGRALHDPLDLAELTAHLVDHAAAGPAHRLHRQRAEQIGHQAADEEPDDHRRIVEQELGRLAVDVEVGGVVGEEHERRQARRADGVALGHRLRGVAHGIERVGDAAHLGVEPRHFGDAAGVVGDRPVGIERHDHAGHRRAWRWRRWRCHQRPARV